jgi:hypothetical protein
MMVGGAGRLWDKGSELARFLLHDGFARGCGGEGLNTGLAESKIVAHPRPLKLLARAGWMGGWMVCASRDCVLFVGGGEAR